MSTDQSESEGACKNMIDPAPVPIAQVVGKKPISIRIPPSIIEGFAALSGSVALNPTFGNLPAIKMLEILMMSKLSFLPHLAAKALMVGGEVLAPAIAIYVGLKLLGKFTDIGVCLAGGLYHTGAAILSGIGVVFKNIIPITKTCFNIPAGILCPAYATHLSSRKFKVSFERSARWNFNTPNPPIVAVSYLVNIVVGVIFVIWTGSAYVPPYYPKDLIIRQIMVYPLSWLALNALYIVGRCAKERREAAQKVS